MASSGLKIISSNLQPTDAPAKDLHVSFLELVVEDDLNHRRYEIVLVGTPRGLTFNVVRRTEL